MDQDLTLVTPPVGHYFTIENFGNGWLAVTLKELSSGRTIFGEVAPRPDPALFNMEIKPDLNRLDLEITQPSALKAVALRLVERYEHAKRSEHADNLQEVERLNSELYIGGYSD